jgi:hypothetical protein
MLISGFPVLDDQTARSAPVMKATSSLPVVSAARRVATT